MRPTVNMWSSVTTVYAQGLKQLPAALDGRPMVLAADARLESQVEAVQDWCRAEVVVPIAPEDAPDHTRNALAEALHRHPRAVPVALGGGSVMDVVRLAALAAVDPSADGFQAAADGVTFLPTRAVNPSLCIPSTLGTASEVSAVAVRASLAGVALIVSPGLRSSGAILDPSMTGSLPRAALAAGLVEPWARVCVPAVAGSRLRLQDGVARGHAVSIWDLGGELAQSEPDESWRLAAALASASTHLSLVALGREPAGHVLWPLATEVSRAAGWTKVLALAALLPAWLRCLAAGLVGRAWGSAARVVEVLGVGPDAAADRLESWLRALSLPTFLPAIPDLESVVSRVQDPWQASGLFLHAVERHEIATVLLAACAPGVEQAAVPAATR